MTTTRRAARWLLFACLAVAQGTWAQADLWRQPYVQAVSSSSATIAWVAGPREAAKLSVTGPGHPLAQQHSRPVKMMHGGTPATGELGWGNVTGLQAAKVYRYKVTVDGQAAAQ